MKDNNLLASVALFSELYDSKKDIYDVIAEFIKTSVITEAKWSFTAFEVTNLLEQVFDFKIPEAVVKSTLNNRLKKENFISFDNGLYSIVSENIKKSKPLSIEFEILKGNQRKIFDNLIDYVEIRKDKKLTELEKENLNKDFNSYLLGNGVNDINSKYISSYIIENQSFQNFTESLNIIKEGLVLYTGIRYTGNINDLGSWNTELTIFLDTEHLFNSVGYNGSIYEEIFKDFYNLVQEINNDARKKKGKKIIDLRYFNENKDEVDNFFYVAEKIMDGKAVLDPSKTAMHSILDGCKTTSDVVAKKVSFYQYLKTNGIHPEESIDYYKNYSHNIEGEEILNGLKKQADDNRKFYDEEECIHFLKLFTKINALRKGVSNNGFERVRYVLLSGKNIAHFLAHNKLVKVNDKDIPFATDIDFITDKFWFKLKKGFSDKESLPKSFDIITKAQIVLSTQINSSISNKYSELTNKIKSGELTQEQAISTYSEYRERMVKPEEIVPDIIDTSLVFLNDDNIEKHRIERAYLAKKVKEGEAAIKELNRIHLNEIIDKKKIKKRKINFLYNTFIIISILLTITIPVVAYLVVNKIKTNQDTLIQISSFLIALIIEFLGLFKYARPINKWCKLKCKKRYLILINKINND